MLTVEEQIYGVSQIWSEAKYNFAFWNTRENIDWDREYQETLKHVMRPMTLLDYYLELSRFISLLNDGHSHIDFPTEVSKDFLTLPVKIKYINGKHIITNTAADCGIPLFSEILEINGIRFDTYMQERILPYCWNIKPESAYEMLYLFSWFEDNADKSAYALIPVIENNKEVRLLTSNGPFHVSPVSRQTTWTLPISLKSHENLTEIFRSEGLMIQLTEDNIAILTLPTFLDDTMPENFYQHLTQLSDCKGFVVDIRNNEGGHSDNADAFAQAFIEGEFQTGKVKHALHIGAYRAWGYGADFTTWNLDDPLEKRVYEECTNNLFEEELTTAYFPNCPLTLHQPLVILENAATASSSENLLISLDTIHRAVIVGVPSYGSTGNPLFIKLPGGGMARVCTRRYTYPDDTEFINSGIKPQIYADLSLEDLQSGHDSVLDTGLSALREIL